MERVHGFGRWWPVAATCAIWSASCLVDHGAVGAALVAGYAAGCLLLGRHPVPGALVVGATQACALAVDVGMTNTAGLMPALVSLTVLGLRTRTREGVPVLLAFLGVIWATGLPTERALVGYALFTATYVLARTMRGRMQRLEQARERARYLAGCDARSAAAEIADAQRARMITRSARILGDALQAMRGDALRASTSLDLAPMQRVQARGEETVERLRELLGPLEPAPAAADPPRRRRVGPWAGDTLLAAGLATVGLLELWAGDDIASDWTTAALGTLLCAALVLRRQAPSLAACTGSSAVLLACGLGVPMTHGLAEGTALALLTWGAVRVGTAWSLVAAALLCTGAVAAAVQRSPGFSAVAAAIVLVAALTAWRTTHLNRDLGVAAELVDRLGDPIDRLVRSRVEHDRVRIARELHDITSHAVGVMVLQAAAGRALRVQDPDAARGCLATAAAAGAAAHQDLVELTRSLPHRERDFGQAVEALARALRGTGVSVQVGEVATLEPGPASDTALRVVQEALTNVVKHAPGTRAGVRVSALADRVEVEVTNTRPPAPGAPALVPGCGAGLAGLDGRIRALDGSLHAAPTDDGGFGVVATLPLPDRARVGGGAS